MHDHIPISETEVTVKKMRELIAEMPDEQVIRIAIMRDYTETEVLVRPIGSMLQGDDQHDEGKQVVYVVAYMSHDGYGEFMEENGVADESHKHPDTDGYTTDTDNPFAL